VAGPVEPGARRPRAAAVWGDDESKLGVAAAAGAATTGLEEGWRNTGVGLGAGDGVDWLPW